MIFLPSEANRNSKGNPVLFTCVLCQDEDRVWGEAGWLDRCQMTRQSASIAWMPGTKGS